MRGFSRAVGAAPDAGAIESDSAPLADDDEDGLPDTWETLHGLNPADPTDAFSDVDGDGQTALAEFHSRTDPADPQSALRLEVRLSPPAVLRGYPRVASFLWSYIPGVTYEVETSTDLHQWRKALGSLFVYGALDGRPAMLYEALADSAMSFYRVRVKENIFD